MAYCDVSDEHIEYVTGFKCKDCKHCYPTRSRKRCEGYRCDIDRCFVRASGDACIFFEEGGENEKIQLPIVV